MFPHLFPGEKHLKSLQSYSPGIFKFYFIFYELLLCCLFVLVVVALPLGYMRCVEEMPLPLTSGSGTRCTGPTSAECLLFCLSAPRKLVALPEKLCLCWWCQDAHLAATFILPDVSCSSGHAWPGGKERDPEPVAMCCRQPGVQHCHLSASQQRAEELPFLLSWLAAIPQFAHLNITQVTQHQLSALLPSPLPEECSGFV